MNVTLLVATLNRTDSLRLLLTSLREQTWKNFSLLLADQNPPGFLDMLLAEYSDLPITRVIMPSVGVSRARNKLILLSDADIIAFPDDDCFYAPDTLAAVVQFFSEHQNYGAVLGHWVPDGHTYAARRSIAPVSRYTAFYRGETYTQFYRAQVVRSIGGFDEQIGPGGPDALYVGGEDTDYLLRAMFARFSIVRSSAIRVFHPSPDMNAEGADAKAESYGKARMYLLRKYKFPFLFKLMNVLYPLVKVFSISRAVRRYRWAMFLGRFRGLFES